jgi:hypothetical protein
MYDETKTLDMDRFDPKKLNDVEFSNRLSALKRLGENVNKNRTCENV